LGLKTKDFRNRSPPKAEDGEWVLEPFAGGPREEGEVGEVGTSVLSPGGVYQVE